jgi:hypothetical protein
VRPVSIAPVAVVLSLNYPRSFLFTDEVGSGKTVEGGLVIRELLVSARASRILLLFPRL